MIVLLFSINTIQCQLKGSYEIEDFDHSHYCYLTFLEEGYYFLEIIKEETIDMSLGFEFSYGTFSEQGNEIILTDIPLGYQFKLQKDSAGFMVTESFKWLKNKQFIFVTHDDDKRLILDVINDLSKQNKTDYHKKRYFLYPLKTGIYKREGFSLHIQAGNRYRYLFNHIVLSEGTWTQDGNEITLFDPTLKRSFKTYMDGKKLSGRYLPGNLEDDFWFEKKE